VIGTFRKGQSIIVKWRGESFVGRVIGGGKGSMQVALSTGKIVELSLSVYGSDMMVDNGGSYCQISSMVR